MVTVLAIGAGVATAALVDDGPGSVARPSTAAATVTSTNEVDTLWQWLAALPAADREKVITAIVPDVHGALQAIVAGMIAPGVGH